MKWLPRLRGDGPPVKIADNGVNGAPPPARGWTFLSSAVT